MKTEIIKIHPEFPEREKIARCAKIIRQGGLVVFPTETVYGVAGDEHNNRAMERLRTVKRRSADKPFSILISKKDEVAAKTPFHDTRVFKLADRYWPGPLTMILSSMEEGKTIGIRMPDHPVALALVKESGCVIAAPSANFENNPSPRTCEEALRDMDGLVEAALDAGPARIGTASTIVDFSKGKPLVTRKGEVVQEDVDEVVNTKLVLMVCTGNSCRSVMAEYLLKDKLRRRKDIEVVSAGTNVFLTAGASSGALRFLRKKGIDAKGHISRPVTKMLLYKADLILVMAQQHRDMILQFLPEVGKRTFLLGEFAEGGLKRDMDIADPMGLEDSVYEESGRIIEEALEKVIKIL
ncbi:MAG: L-threonylcarbamoyladenylate synthase [Candidatus Omnitrophota bacterium]